MSDEKRLEPDCVVLPDGKKVDECLHAPMLESVAGNEASHRQAVRQARKLGWSEERIAAALGPTDPHKPFS